METLTGIVERITFSNEDSGFCVIKVKTKGFTDLVTVVGNLAAVNVGAVVRLTGEWKMDSKYGKQLIVHDYQETVPATIAGMEKYLGSGLIKGIGPVNAKRIVRHFKETTLEIIEAAPERLIEVEGIGAKRVEMIQKAWQEQKEIKNVMLFLQSQGVSTAYAVKIYKTYGNKSIEVVRENPYRLADEIWGIGFKTADKIAEHLGFARDSYERCRAGIIYMLNQFANEGHCFMPSQQLAEESAKILEQELDHILHFMERMVKEKSVILDGEDGIYLPVFYYSEIGVAKYLRMLLPASDLENSSLRVAKIKKQDGITYDQYQTEAIQRALSAKLLVLTGGPGTGKTTITLAVIQSFVDLEKKVLLAAPTGRAAKRMTEATGMEAKTIHRLLEYSPAEGYKRKQEQPLDCDVLIIDEVSMVDIILMYHLLKALPQSASLILVGDADQLPSVGAGNVLRDIIASECVPVVRLTKIFRQAQGSMIVTNAHRINQGEFPVLKGGRDNDFFFIEEEDPEKIPDQIRNLCEKRLPNFYGVNSIEGIQVLCPMQRGTSGTIHLNNVLQEALNPSRDVVKYGLTTYKTQDKVMQIKNNYDKGVFNGDIGIIKSIDQEEKQLIITFDEVDVNYDLTEMDELVLSYAITVHKSQGSEYQVVVAPFVNSHYLMLQRNLLYTCLTRAKRIFVGVGTKKALAMAVRNNKIVKRNTMLAQRLKEKYS